MEKPVNSQDSAIFIHQNYAVKALAYDPDYLWNTYCTNDKYEEKFIISDELADELKLRLAPFHYEEQLLDRFDKEHFLIRDGTFPNFSAQYPFTDISTILPNCEHPSKMLETSGLDGLMKFWVSTTTGILSTKLKDELGSLDITTSEIDYNGRQSELFNLVVKGIQGNLEQDDAAFPFAYSLTQLVFARSLKFHHWQEATLIVVGDTLEDFCLYYCLSRMRKRVAWLLPSWLPDGEIESVSDWYDGNPLGLFTRALRDSGRYRQSNGSVFLMSASVLPERIGEIRELFNHSRISINIEEGLPIENDVLIDNENYEKVLSSSLEWLLRYPTRVFERDNFDKVVDRHFINSPYAAS